MRRCTAVRAVRSGVQDGHARAPAYETLHPGDPEAQALAFEVRRAPRPPVASSSRAHATERSAACRTASPSGATLPDAHALIHSVVLPAAEEDPDVYRALTRRDLQLDPVGALAENTAVLERARALAATREPKAQAAPTPDARRATGVDRSRNPQPVTASGESSTAAPGG